MAILVPATDLNVTAVAACDSSRLRAHKLMPRKDSGTTLWQSEALVRLLLADADHTVDG